MNVYSDLIKEILNKRGFKDEKSIYDFLNPDYVNHLHNPFNMKDMDKACIRLFDSISKNEKIMIYTDYDADGIPAGVMLCDLFKKIKYENFEIYIPNRNTEGYGLSKKAIDEFIEKNINLLITIDLGISAIEEIEYAKLNNIDTIIVDHHLPHFDKEKNKIILPPAYAILNPKIDNYKEKMLCASGVLFKFIQGFLFKYRNHFNIKEGWEKWLLDMAGLATIADMVPLLGENRAIAFYGLKVLRKSPRIGLQKLLSKMNINQKRLSEDDLYFMLIPRINAASRMDSPKTAFQLLSTEDYKEASILAEHLTKINDDRKNIVLNIMKQVKNIFEKRNEFQDKDIIVIGSPSWRVGVLGIVAGKVMEEHNKTVFVWGRDENDIIKGSCRSPGNISLVDLMANCKEYFIEYGGHELAGGFSVLNDKIHFLEDALNKVFNEIKKEKNDLNIEYDIEGDLSLVNIKTWKEIDRLSPFGFSNKKITFFFPNLIIENIRKFGKNGSGEHLEIIFLQNINNKIFKIKGISFFSNIDSFTKKIENGKKVNLLANFELSFWRGKEELRLRIVDII